MNKVIYSLGCLMISLVLAMPVMAGDRSDDYRGHHGYREHPYDRGRHYGHYQRHGHKYEYRGHWRSWDEWDRYARNHPYLYKHGHYYREGGHLMFRFCEPEDTACIFFSIGR